MKIEVDNVKGFTDYLPPESLKRAAIKKIVEETYRLYGFAPVETPIIEYDEMMKPDMLPNETEDEAVSDRFRLQDRASRNLGLRYEFTFQLAKIFKLNPNIKLPFRRYQIGEQFRDEPIRAGRTRQFTQCDADILGDSSLHADAECLALAKEIFTKLGIKAEAHVNNRKLIDAIIESCEITAKKQVLKEIDKMDKIGEDNVKMNLKKYADSNQIITLFKLLGKDIDFFIENGFEGAKELKELGDLCKTYGFVIKIRPTLVRGFSYYTGNVFEFMTDAKYAIAGGGRYDKTVGKFLNREIPAVGISFSIEAIMGLCSDAINKLETSSLADVIVISIGKERDAIKLTSKLRKEGVSTITMFDKPGKAIEYANVQQIRYVIFIGEKEAEKKKFTLRNMGSGKESLLAEKSLISTLKKELS
jgi:histidyl-tRNA synthetase